MPAAPPADDAAPVPRPVFERARAAFLEGVAHHEAGRFEAARDAFLASLALVPGRVSTLSNLGAAWLKLGRPAEALAALDEAVARAPEDRDAALHRADALLALGDAPGALGSVDRALAADGAFAGGWLRRGEVLARLERAEEALAAFERAGALAPAGERVRALAARHRGNLLREAGRLDAARDAFTEALHATAADAASAAARDELRFLLAAVAPPGSAAMPEAAPPGLVRDLFDGYADDYDRHLLGPLGYRAHRALVEPLGGIVGRTVFGRAVDLGCGTGLCGPLLRPFVSHLTGVDLAPRMLALAAASGAYDALVRADAVDTLAAAGPGSLDLVVAADVLIYIGDPEPLVRAAARALAPGGVLAVTVERLAEDAAETVRLDPTLRYRHADALWPRLAAQHGFALRAMRPETLRLEQGRPVEGRVVVLVRKEGHGGPEPVAEVAPGRSA